MEEVKNVKVQLNEEALMEKIRTCHHAIANHLSILIMISDKLLRKEPIENINKDISTIKVHAENIHNEIKLFRSYFVEK